MANSDKDIKITPNTGSASLPKIEFTGADNATKTISVADSGALSFDGDLTVSNLTVSGSTTTVNTETVTIDDNILVLNNNQSGTPSENAGLEIERGTSTNVLFRWNETSDRWEFTNDGSTYYNIPISSEYANGDITSVTAGTGLSGGGSSGAVTLNVSGLTISEFAGASITTSAEAFADNDTTLMTSAAINDRIESFGYITTDTDTTYTAASGGGLSLSGTQFSIDDPINLSQLTESTDATTDKILLWDESASSWKYMTLDDLQDSIDTTGASANDTTITLSAGTGLSGGGDFTTNQASIETITFNVSGLTVTELAGAALQTSAEAFADSDAVLMTAAAINDRIESFGYTTNTGDITGVTAGTGLSGGGASGSVTLNVSGLTTTEFAAGSILTSAESFVDSDTQVMTAAAIADKIESYGYSTTTGDITGVTAGTGLSGGGSSGTVTLNVSGITVSEIAAGSILIAGETFADNDTSLMTAAAINDRIESFGYTTNTGDITGVTAGTGLSGGGSSGGVTLAVDLSELTDMTATMVGTDEFIVLDAGADRRKAASEIGLSIFNNDSGFTTNTGDITAVTAGTGLSGGGSSGSVTLNVSGLTVSEIAAASLTTSLEVFADNDTTLMTSAAINDRIESFGYTTNTGDITGVTAGTGLSGGGSSGSVTLNVDLKDEDNMISNSATHAASQQSIKAYVDAEVAGIVDAAPAALDTLNELAAALGDDANYATTTSTALGNRVRVDTAAQGLTSTQKSNARTNIGVDAAGTDNSTNVTLVTTSHDYLSIAGQAITLGQIDISDDTNLVAGTGISLSGDTLNVGGLTVSELAAGSIQLSTEAFADNDTSLMTSAAINDRIESFGYTTNTGDITGVTAGTGLSGGGTSGSVTLNVSGLTVSEIAAGSILIAGETFADNDTSLMTAAAINDRIESFGYTTNTGDITGVTAGTGLSGGGSSGSVTLNVSGLTTSELAAASLTTSAEAFADNDTTLMTSAAIDDRILSYGYTTNTGDITGVTAGTGLSGGGASGSVTLNLANTAVTAGSYTSADITVDAQGRITAASSGSGGGGASVLGDLTDVLIDATNFTDGFLIQTDSNGLAPTTSFTGNNTGNIGLGKDVFTSMTSGSNFNVGIGYRALDALTTGDYNIAIGYDAGSSVQTTSSGVYIGEGSGRLATGYFNTLVGRRTGYSLTSGSYNAIMGGSAGENNTTGSKNTFVGYLAGYDSGTTSESVFLGYAAGRLVKAAANIGVGNNALQCSGTGGTGNQNIAIGHSSMQALQGSAGFNVGVGGETFKNLTTGNNNSALGHEAGENINTGSNNVILGYEAVTQAGANPSDTVAIGYQAGWQNNGSKNVFVGKNAGSSGSVNNNGLSTGQENVGIGYFSLYSLTTGNTNIAIGNAASNNITAGSNNVVIGEANVPSATGDSQLSISNGDGTVQWIEGNSSGVVLGALTPLFFERSALDTNSIDFRVPVAGSGPATPNAYPMPYDGEILAASFLFSGATITGTASNTLRVRKNGGSSGADIEDFTFTPSDLTNPTGTNYTLVKTGLSLAFNAGDIIQVRRNSGTTDLNNAQAIVWVRYNM